MYLSGNEAEMTQDRILPDPSAHGADDGLESQGGSGTFSILANVAGAVMSLGLIAGIGVWGYSLLVRDVSGIPIVRAAEGEMRVPPSDPGGQLAQHIGLAVNAIAAEGQASGPVDKVVLAPPPVALRPEDGQAPVTQPAPLGSAEAFLSQAVVRLDAPLPAATTEAETPAPSAAVPVETPAPQVEALAEEDAGAALLTVADTGGQLVAQPAVLDAPGLQKSLRPRLRPASGGVVQPAAFTPAESRPEVDPSAIPSGTRLAQLGAFDSAEVARAEWTRLERRFGEILGNKSRVVQKVTSGGRDFYRLRAMGFRDLNDARRFCSAFKAEGVDCIPVASR